MTFQVKLINITLFIEIKKCFKTISRNIFLLQFHQNGDTFAHKMKTITLI